MSRLDGKVAFITGAARGQGRSHSVRLAQDGADIIAVDICAPVRTVPYALATAADLAETVRLVEALGRRIVSAEVDIRDMEALTAAADAGVAQFGCLDIVVANAGIWSMSKALDMSEQMWTTMIDVTFNGQWRTVKAAAGHIVAGGRGGSIVLTSSLAAMLANEHIAHYTAAKSGLIGLMRVLAKELAPHNIRVNTRAPHYGGHRHGAQRPHPPTVPPRPGQSQPRRLRRRRRQPARVAHGCHRRLRRVPRRGLPGLRVGSLHHRHHPRHRPRGSALTPNRRATAPSVTRSGPCQRSRHCR